MNQIDASFRQQRPISLGFKLDDFYHRQQFFSGIGSEYDSGDLA